MAPVRGPENAGIAEFNLFRIRRARPDISRGATFLITRDGRVKSLTPVDRPPDNAAEYWRANLRVMAMLLCVWFVVSFVLGIILVEPLNHIRLGGFPLGFWFAHQGAIYSFVVLVLIYVLWMDRLDRRYGVD